MTWDTNAGGVASTVISATAGADVTYSFSADVTYSFSADVTYSFSAGVVVGAGGLLEGFNVQNEAILTSLTEA